VTHHPIAPADATGSPPTKGEPAHPGGWRKGDPVAWRKFEEFGPVTFELGGSLPVVDVAYETWGELNDARDNAVFVCHALTGDAHVNGVAGPGQPTPGWWDGLIGPDCPLDTRNVFVIASNVLGGCQGTTGPSAKAPDGRAYGSRFPQITTRDQVQMEIALAERLGIRKFAAVIGGSMGGMRAIEWAVMRPDLVETAVVLASTPYTTGDQLAWNATQLAAIRSDPHWNGGDYYDTGTSPQAGLGIARSIAHTTYRSEYELSTRFARKYQQGENPLGGGGRYAVESYLDHHKEKLVSRFEAGSYVTLTEAMNAHDIGRGRGGMRAALKRQPVDLRVAAVDSDRLFPPRLSSELLAAAGRHPNELLLIRSAYGHDGFLIERELVGNFIRSAVDGR
jgi:homoserine O-acetyltransferase/O-succinyltransferase